MISKSVFCFLAVLALATCTYADAPLSSAALEDDTVGIKGNTLRDAATK